MVSELLSAFHLIQCKQLVDPHTKQGKMQATHLIPGLFHLHSQILAPQWTVGSTSGNFLGSELSGSLSLLFWTLCEVSWGLYKGSLVKIWYQLQNNFT